MTTRPDDGLVTSDVGRATEAVRAGGLVAIPTETVYGLAADATNETAVRRIFEVKDRPLDHPLIVHIAGAQDLGRWTTDVGVGAHTLAAAAWPGPLSMIVPRSVEVPDVITGGRDTVAIRVPAHELTLDLLRRSGVALAAPSANRFGRVSPTTVEHVLADLGDVLDPELDVVLDGGPCRIGVESTIVDCCSDPPQVLRAGGIPVEDIAALLAGGLAPADGPARASGMLPSHYAPTCQVRLVDDPGDAMALRAGTAGAEILDLTDDLVAYARELYARLRDADDRGVDVVIAVLPPPVGLGHAIRDRLVKASAPR